jgi:hypothetical protein
MTIFLGVLKVVLHRAAVYPPIADWPLLNAVRHQVGVLLDEHEDHLKPELSPAVVTDRRVLIQTNRLFHSRRVSENLFVEHKLETTTFRKAQHVFKHVF